MTWSSIVKKCQYGCAVADSQSDESDMDISKTVGYSDEASATVLSKFVVNLPASTGKSAHEITFPSKKFSDGKIRSIGCNATESGLLHVSAVSIHESSIVFYVIEISREA